MRLGRSALKLKKSKLCWLKNWGSKARLKVPLKAKLGLGFCRSEASSEAEREKAGDYMKVITSRKNSIIRHAADIALSSEKRQEERLFFIEGARLCEDAARSGVRITAAFFTETALEKYAEYISEVKAQAAECFEVSQHVAELLSQTKTTQGVFCLCEMPKGESCELAGKWIALENLQNPLNLGATMRTAEALGLAGVILSGESCDVYSPKSLRASMGAVFRMPVVSFSSSAEMIAELKSKGFDVYAAVPCAVDGGTVERLGELSFPENAAVIVGNEGSGLMPETIAACKGVTIPMKGRAESLNAAAAAAIIMWEMVR